MRTLSRFLVILYGLPLCAQVSLSTADRLIADKKYAEAAKTLQEYQKQNTSQEVRDRLGEVYGYLGSWDQAIAIYQALSQDFPDSARYRFRYAAAMAKKAQASNVFIALTYLGRIKENFNKALELDPTSIETHWALIDLYVSIPGLVGGSTEKAETYARRLKELSEVDGFLALGYVFEYREEPELARTFNLKALRVLSNTDNVDRNQLHYQIGKICGDYEIKVNLGIRHMKRYINNYSLMDGVPLEWAYYRLARLYRISMNKPEALYWLEKSLETKPDFKPARTELKEIESL